MSKSRFTALGILIGFIRFYTFSKHRQASRRGQLDIHVSNVAYEGCFARALAVELYIDYRICLKEHISCPAVTDGSSQAAHTQIQEKLIINKQQVEKPRPFSTIFQPNADRQILAICKRLKTQQSNIFRWKSLWAGVDCELDHPIMWALSVLNLPP